MKTEIIKLDRNNIDKDKLRFAADILRNGGLVAFPTETVYGLGANALDERAVRGIFTAKGRPSDNPLIVHIAHRCKLEELTSGVPSGASLLIEKFWPGPLTFVLDKSAILPKIITAGLDTVAVRMPSHPIALALIEESGVPIAAPSANSSGKPSPTTAKHVIDDLSGKIDVIIDGGSANVGLESTVLDLTVYPPMILRPGGVTPSQLEAVLGKVAIDPALSTGDLKDVVPKSPGMKYTHYSPKASVIIVEGRLTNVVEKIKEMAGDLMKQGTAVGIMATEQTRENYTSGEVISIGDRENPPTIAANLFYALREFDEKNVQVILAEAIENKEMGFAVMNRMIKAAGHNIVRAD